MKIILTVIQIFLAVITTTLIFLQSSGDTESRSNLLSTVHSQKRGWEKVMFYATIIILVIFLLSSIVQSLV